MANNRNDGGTMLNSQMMNDEWKWNGCSPNIIAAIELSKLFLDSAEHELISPYSIVNLHNNNVGRKVNSFPMINLVFNLIINLIFIFF